MSNLLRLAILVSLLAMMATTALAQRRGGAGGFGQSGVRIQGGFGHGGIRGFHGGFAQPGVRGFHGVRPFGHLGVHRPFGRIGHRPFVHRPFVHRPFVHRPFVHRPFVHRPFFTPFPHRSAFVVPHAFPVFVGGFAAQYPYPYYPSPHVTIIQLPPPTQPEPEVDRGAWREERPREAPRPEAARPPVYFLIPIRDGPVHSVVAYWVEDDTLHYVDVEGRRGQVPLAEVDRELAERMNRDKEIEFRLPLPRE